MPGLKKISLIKINIMQKLKEKLKEDLKVAIKSSNNVKKEIIKLVLSEVALEEKRGAAGFLLNDEGVMAVIKKLKKSCEITKEGYEKQEQEVPSQILDEIAALDSYLPQKMSEEQVVEKVEFIINELNATSMKDMGKVMFKFNSDYCNQADGKIVSQIVRAKLTEN